MSDYDYGYFEVEVEKYESSYVSTETGNYSSTEKPQQNSNMSHNSRNDTTPFALDTDFSGKDRKYFDGEFPMIPMWLFYFLTGGAIIIILGALIYYLSKGKWLLLI